MVYRVPQVAPESQVPPERRGRVMGRFCLICASVYPLHRATHTGRPVYGRDHIASTCAHEGDAFGFRAVSVSSRGEPTAAGEGWWEPAVEVAAPAVAAAAGQPAAAAPGAPAASAAAPPAVPTPSPVATAPPAAKP